MVTRDTHIRTQMHTPLSGGMSKENETIRPMNNIKIMQCFSLFHC